MNQHKEDAKSALEDFRFKKLISDELKTFVGKENTQENRDELIEKLRDVLK